MGTCDKHWNANSIPDQSGRVAVVTGSNTGIGLETARELARAGATVVLACRSIDKATRAAADIQSRQSNANVLTMRLDLADLESVRGFAGEFESRFRRLDHLINNAGVMTPPKSTTRQGFELQFGVNHLGHFALTGLLLPRLLVTRGARVVNVSSHAHRQGALNFDDLDWTTRPYKKMAAYGDSKLANLLFTFELNRRLKTAQADLLVVAAHPGWTRTDLQRHEGVLLRTLARAMTPFVGMQATQGALPTLRAATDPGVETGDFFGPDGVLQLRGYPRRVGTSKSARDQSAATRLWRVSTRRTGVDIDAMLNRTRQAADVSPTAPR
ncbi:MAG: oxidoreductase [Nannocystales bacterium]